jgi:hypothetical protein
LLQLPVNLGGPTNAVSLEQDATIINHGNFALVSLSTDHKMEHAPLCAFFFFFALGGCSTTFIAASKTPFTFCNSGGNKKKAVSSSHNIACLADD